MPDHVASSALPEIVTEFEVPSCFICGINPGLGTTTFTTHVAQHLERIAFMVLAKPYGDWKFYDDVESNSSSVGAMAMDPEVIEFIVQGRIANVKQLLHDGIVRDGIMSTGRSALHLAAAHGQCSIVWLLLHAGFDVNLEATDPSCQRWTALHYASAAGHISTVGLLLKAGALQTPNEPTPLLLALENGHHAAFEMLLASDHGLDFDSPNPPLSFMLAVRTNCAEIVQSFLTASEQNADKCRNRDRQVYPWFPRILGEATEWNAEISILAIFEWAERPTIYPELRRSWEARVADFISIACRKENVDIARLHLSAPFLERPPVLSIPVWKAIARSKGGRILREEGLLGSATSLANGLVAAAELGDLDLFTQVFEKAGAVPAGVWTGASAYGNLGILLALLNRGIKPVPGCLREAIMTGHFEVISTLLRQFPHLFPAQETDNALDVAVEWGQLDCVQFLIRERFPEPEPELFKRLFLSAVAAGSSNIVDWFLNETVGESLSTDTVTEALVAAIKKKHVSTVERLLIRHSPTTAVTYDGDNLLHLAARVGSTAITRRCLSLGIDVNSIGSRGTTALFNACDDDHWESARLLLSYGGEIKSRVSTYDEILRGQLASELFKSSTTYLENKRNMFLSGRAVRMRGQERSGIFRRR